MKWNAGALLNNAIARHMSQTDPTLLFDLMAYNATDRRTADRANSAAAGKNRTRSSTDTSAYRGALTLL